MGTNLYQGGLATPISVTNDIDNNGRSVTLPAVGADEMACPVPVISIASQSNILCNGGNNGLAIVTAIGGLNHTYSWSPVSNTTNSISNQVASTHTVYVTNHCALTGSLVVTITQPTSITPIATWTDVSCFSYSNGIAAVVVSGGTPGYSYSWSPSSSTSSVANNLPQGTQSYTVTDANGCTINGTIGISQPATSVTAIGSSTSACASQSTGAVSATVSGGYWPYTYSWTPSVSTWSMAFNLFPGTYTFQATDAAGCTSAPLPVTIATDPTPTVSATSNSNIICAGSTVTLTALASTGVTYTWSNGGNNAIEVTSPVSNTQYTITVSYTNGCTAEAFVTVTVSTCAGLNALTDNAGIQTFPNPNSGQLFVTYNGFTQGASIEVYNTVGQLMLKKNIESSTTEMNLNNYSNGIYIVKVLSAKGKIEQVTKLIKD
ncbi:MAG: T9SS type A sorting domain-containing protein [Sphingobacteriaceae bacterium]|nr:T9SS type A sorting domain-containing protein [Sphingobacteriaceae bacterium]